MAADDQDNSRLNMASRVLEKYGLPTLLLLLFCGAAAFGVYRAACWVAPLMERALNKHIEFIDSSTAQTKEMVGTQKELQRTQVKQEETLQSLDASVKGIQDIQESIDKTLKRLPTKPEQP